MSLLSKILFATIPDPQAGAVAGEKHVVAKGNSAEREKAYTGDMSLRLKKPDSELHP